MEGDRGSRDGWSGWKVIEGVEDGRGTRKVGIIGPFALRARLWIVWSGFPDSEEIRSGFASSLYYEREFGPTG